MKQYRTRIFCSTLAITLALSGTVTALGAAPLSKDESVYANLGQDGSVESIYVVNTFELADAAQITDYGSYSQLKNLTTSDPLLPSGDSILIHAPAGKFSYQGTLNSRDIPWRVTLGYTLDGQTITGDALGGASGRLVMTLGLARNPAVSSVYADNFALQISAQLDTELCKNIVAEGATAANVGSSRQLSYMVLPGQEKTFTLSADVTDFQMEPVQISGIPLTLDIDAPDTAELTDKLNELKDGAVELDDGATQLSDGSSKLYDGVSELRDGVTDLSDGVYDLYDGVREMNKELPKLAGGINDLAGGIQELSGGFDQLNQQGAALETAVQQSLQAVGQLPLPPEVLALLQGALGGTLGYMQGVQALGGAVTQMADGTGQLSLGAGGAADGVDSLERGLRDVYQGTVDLKDGAEQLYDGVAELKDGTVELADGTGQLRDQSGTMDTQMQDEVDKLIGQYQTKDFTLTSFVSARNGTLENLQFVCKTPGITRPEVAQVIDVEPPATSLWERITSLFKPKAG